MSNFWVSLILAIGAGGWIYGAMYRKTGGLSQTALAFAGICGLIIFFVALIILGMIF